MKKLFPAVLAALLAACGTAQAKDGFEAVHCGSDVAKALMGQRMSNGPVAAIERRHVELGLKDLGGDEISDRLNSTSWRICAQEYMLLSDARDTVLDVIPVPSHSRRSPEFAAGTCRSHGKDMPGLTVAILDNSAAAGKDAPLLPAVAAWKIDEKSGKFVKLAVSGLTCPRNGIITADGGP